MTRSTEHADPRLALSGEALTHLPWHDVARWHARRQRWLTRGALLGLVLALVAAGFVMAALPGDPAYRLACAVSLLLPSMAVAALTGHIGARLYEHRVPHPLEELL